jgi:uncharacterized protein (DUF952 family)
LWSKSKYMNFYHITTPELWDKYKEQDFYEAASLHTEGFIHCSYSEQLHGTLEKYYTGVPHVLLLLIDPTLLTSKLVVEASRNGELFPHIYGSINKSAIKLVINKK